jgi:hypothetical protein
MSAAARLRFLGRGCGRGKNVRPMSGKGIGVNCNVDDVVWRVRMDSKYRTVDELDDACSFLARIILRHPTSCVLCTMTKG